MSVPDEPSNTCPLIDKVIDDGLEKAEEAYAVLNDIDFSGLKDEMERIRDANSDLRERAGHFEDLCEQKDEELSKVTDERDALLAQVETLKDELKHALLQQQVALAFG